jgi:DNA helicase-2/ATP-dependent DNA helicase PcrA
MIDVSKLNPQQKEAVLSDDSYLRIIAGAGSGKTRVLTMRIAHLIDDEDVRPYKILALTFTNKAAKEMQTRVGKMLGEIERSPWISTIHSLCVRILREDISVEGYPKNFTIMDADDQKSIVKAAVKALNIGDNGIAPNAYIDYISNNKTAGITAERAHALAPKYSDDQDKADVYERYLTRQREMFALDFDDLILWTVRIFHAHRDVLEKWQRRFEYILVDEFQDIDETQYKLIRSLTGKENSLYVVGDPDQTIYTWRGADVNIIMHFEKDYPGAKTIILNENYRSSSAILEAANSVIQNNADRMKKDLFTTRSADSKVVHFAAPSDEAEAEWIADTVSSLHAKGEKYSDMAVLYRSNYLSRMLEQKLMAGRIPYVIYGGLRFYERQEVKDSLCYLRMVTAADDLALRRILNRPRRGIGDKTMDTISIKAEQDGTTMYEVIKGDTLFSGKIKHTLEDFVSMVEKWRQEEKDGKDVVSLFSDIIQDTGYEKMLNEDKEKGEERLANIKELIDSLRQFMEQNPDSTLDEYLQLTALYGDHDETVTSDYLQLMTVHAAKGLEFNTVFVSDLNDGIFPNERAMNEGRRGVEEERRLAYVAFTRARNQLYLTEASGYSYVLQRMRTPSRFIDEIDSSVIVHKGYAENRSENVRDKVTSSLFEEHGDSFSAVRKPQTKAAKLKAGDHVTHIKFGDGVVVSCAGGIAQIAFPYPYGIKKIAAGHPSLQKKK